MDTKKRLKIFVWDVLLFWISTTTIINLVLLPLKIFYPLVSAIATTITIVIFFYLSRKIVKLELKDSRFGLMLLAIIIISLILRIPPYHYVMGGQDQGTYLNIAHQYAQEHTIYTTDTYRNTLNNQQQKLYDQRGNYIMPSIEKWNRDDSEYSMVFYPAYPSILGLFEILLGQNNMFYALTFFSIISLVNIYLVTHNLSKNKTIALLVLMLLALNPVHVFFSKLPVGEMAALAFITTGFYFLTQYLKGTATSQTKVVNLVLSLLGFFAFSLTRMTFFIYVPVFIIISTLFWKNEKERLQLSIYSFFNLLILIFSYIYYKILLYPLFLKIYPGTITIMFKNYIPTNLSVSAKMVLTLIAITTFLGANIKFNLRKYFKKVIYPGFLASGLFFTYRIFSETKIDFGHILNEETRRFDRWNIVGRGYDAIKHIPLFSVSNYVSIFLFLVFIFLVIRTTINKKFNKYHFLIFTSLYFLFIYVEKSGLMRYDYYNSRYYLTEVIPIILVTTGIFLGELIKKGGWPKKVAVVTLSGTLFYFSIFSFFQIGKFEGNKMNFYEKIDSAVRSQDLIIYINQNIYDSKYPKNFNDYVAGPLKYYFDKNVLVLEQPEEITTPIVRSIFDSHTKIYYISNVPLENYEFSYKEQKVTFDYNYFNNSPGCNYHNYEFLRIDKITEIPLPNSLKCKLLPNAYYERSRDYYFGKISLENLEKANAGQ